MLEQLYTIDEQSLVTDIVARDYRTADVFRKYDIEFCCGGRRPLQMACEMRGVNTEQVKDELEKAIRVIHVSPSLAFHEWPLDFLADYIVHVHHAYLRKALPEAKEHLAKFALGHRKKYAYLDELEKEFNSLVSSQLPHLQHEEEIIFPYIKRIDRAFRDKEPYAPLLVRTLRKPVQETMNQEHKVTETILQRFRTLTGNYTVPENACISHRVTFHKLRELDNDMMQHIHLESDILFRKAIDIEKQLLR